MSAQIQQLQGEKEAALIELQKVWDQQATDSGLLYRTAANVQNTASTATNLNAKLA